MPKVRSRFAPSPTGYLHIGGARTALFSYLFARGQGGTFVLRIEDTDRERSTARVGSSDLRRAALAAHRLGRGALLSEPADRPLQEGRRRARAPARRGVSAATARPKSSSASARPRSARAANRPTTARAATAPTVPTAVHDSLSRAAERGETAFQDIIKGRVAFQNEELDDLIIARSDGSPTYNFCVVVDDHEMAITHVIRGEDHVANTPKQIQLYEAMGYPVPQFAHVPLILGLDRTRLSKRHGATSVIAYRDQGFFPEAMVNYLARLGWSSRRSGDLLDRRSSSSCSASRTWESRPASSTSRSSPGSTCTT